MDPEMKQNADGDFYVEHHCCTACGVPIKVAPDLIEWRQVEVELRQLGKFSVPMCHWKKQPETADEMQQAFAIFDGQELGCHRYSGTDPEIQKRIGRELCDHPVIAPECDSLAATLDPNFASIEDEGFLKKLWIKLFRR